MGEKEGVIDVAPDWVLHYKTFSAFYTFLILWWIFYLISSLFFVGLTLDLIHSPHLTQISWSQKRSGISDSNTYTFILCGRIYLCIFMFCAYLYLCAYHFRFLHLLLTLLHPPENQNFHVFSSLKREFPECFSVRHSEVQKHNLLFELKSYNGECSQPRLFAKLVFEIIERTPVGDLILRVACTVCLSMIGRAVLTDT